MVTEDSGTYRNTRVCEYSHADNKKIIRQRPRHTARVVSFGTVWLVVIVLVVSVRVE